MTTVIEAVFENGAFKPLSEVNLKEHQRYSLIIEELPQDDADGSIDLAASGIDHQQAAELRARLQTFAEDWESEEMSVYDDYDAARSHL